MLRFLNLFFFLFHTLWILFVLTGWIWEGTRKLHLAAVGLTGFSWVILGIRYGMGYCPCTDWHWQVRQKLGYEDMPASYVKFLIDEMTGFSLSASLVDTITVTLFVVALILSIYVNFFRQ